LTDLDRWYRIPSYALVKYLKGRQLDPPRCLQQLPAVFWLIIWLTATPRRRWNVRMRRRLSGFDPNE
jgi:hypothetical protein